MKIENETLINLIVVGVSHLQGSYNDNDRRLHHEFCSLPIKDLMQFWDKLQDSTKIRIITCHSAEIKQVLMKIGTGE